MSTTVPWSAILAAAEKAAPLLPPPANVVATVALGIARAVLDAGCVVKDCPADVKARLQPADIPAADVDFFKARGEAEARVRGLDPQAIRARFDGTPAGPIARIHAEAFHPGMARDVADYDEVDDGDTDDGGGGAAA